MATLDKVCRERDAAMDEVERLRAALAAIRDGCEKYLHHGLGGRMDGTLAQTCLDVARDALALHPLDMLPR